MPRGMRKGTTMKKLLSVVLALLMVSMTAVALIPTAWAEPADQSGGDANSATSAKPAGSWDYYAQNFDDEALVALTGADLATKLGWTAPGEGQTMSIENGKLRYVSTTTAEQYKTDLLGDSDPRMIGSITVVEYDLRLQDKESELNSKQSAYISMGDAPDPQNSAKIYANMALTRFLANASFNKKIMTGSYSYTRYSGSSQSFSRLSSHIDVLNDIPVAENKTDCLDTDYHVKAVVDPVAGAYYLFLNDVVVATLTDNDNLGGTLNFLAKEFTSAFILEITNGADVLLDNIQIYGYKNEPSLAITEIAAVGTYQWIELYNATFNPVNVYDYALHVNADLAADTTFNDNKLSYIKAGTTGDFDNPEYANGVLQPGDTAIILLPKTAIAAAASVTDEDFRTYLGVSEDAKLFACDATVELATEGAMTVGLMEVDKETGIAKYADRNDTLRLFLDSYVMLTTEAKETTTGYESLALSEEIIHCGVSYGEAGQTLELTYWSVHAEETVSRMGDIKYGVSDTRANAAGEQVTQTPGYVPEDCRFDVSIIVTDMNGENPESATGKFMTEWRLENPKKKCYEFLGYSVDGSEELVQSVYMSGDGIKITPKYRRTSPYASWYQVSEAAADGTYSVRFLGGINRKDVWSVGFKYSYTYLNENGKTVTTEVEEYECAYVYTSVTADGEVVNATDLGCEYLFALHVTGIPKEAKNLKFNVSSYVLNSKDTRYNYIESETNEFVIEAPVTPAQ